MRDHPILTRQFRGLTTPHAGTYELDPVHSFIYFSVQHLVIGRVRGRFSSFQGTLIVPEDPTESRVDVVIHTASIDTQNDQRDEDLRSPGMLNVAAFPSMTYRGSGVIPELGGGWRIEGDLSVRDVTRAVPLHGTFLGAVADPFGKLRIAFEARTAISRKEFGLTRELEKESGGLLLAKDIMIEINAECTRVDG